jgi:hypothetical protein
MTTTMTRPVKRPALRFPLQPVMNLTRAENYEQLGIRLGVSGDTVRQWSVRGLSSKQADFVATELGFHPLNIWESFNDDLYEDFDDADDWDHPEDVTPAPAARPGRSIWSKSARTTKPSSTATFNGARRRFLGRN